MSDDLGRLKRRAHHDIEHIEYEGNTVPCVIFPGRRFEQIIYDVAGKPVSVDTNLNILDDGLGHVFVKVSLDFRTKKEEILIDAAASPWFFEMMASSSMMALRPKEGGAEIFMVQLPRPERIYDALSQIRRGLEKCSRRDSDPGHQLGKLE